ncbi:MAG: HAD family hydrolase [Cardiobacteriaceae bacterium]|nr:HAD family hydrolase [Cardiobacteriaceae bacterium]
MTSRFQAVWFDLDGTLLDSADDLIPAVNQTLVDFGYPPVPEGVLRGGINFGSRTMVARGAGLTFEDPQFAVLMERFAEHYLSALHVHSRWYPGVEALLARLEADNIPWGVVTNKYERFTLPLAKSLGIDTRAAAIVGGDTVARNKPHPDSILHGTRLAGHDPARCLFVGDNSTDILAGRAAGMQTAACAYGYTPTGENAADWGADYLLESVDDLYAVIWGAP